MRGPIRNEVRDTSVDPGRRKVVLELDICMRPREKGRIGDHIRVKLARWEHLQTMGTGRGRGRHNDSQECSLKDDWVTHF